MERKEGGGGKERLMLGPKDSCGCLADNADVAF